MNNGNILANTRPEEPEEIIVHGQLDDLFNIARNLGNTNSSTNLNKKAILPTDDSVINEKQMAQDTKLP